MKTFGRLLPLVLAGGCSFALTRNPPREPAGPACTTSMSSVIVDGVVAGVAGLILVGALAGDRNRDADDSENEVAVAASLVTSGVAFAGAIVGHGRVSRCRAAQAPEVSPAPVVVPRPAPVSVPPVAPPSPPAELGTVGDVCNTTSECAAGLTCRDNVCLNP